MFLRSLELLKLPSGDILAGLGYWRIGLGNFYNCQKILRPLKTVRQIIPKAKEQKRSFIIPLLYKSVF